VLAVVCQQVIAAFTEPRTCPLDDLFKLEAPGVVPNPDLMAMREILEGGVFHRPTTKSAGQTSVVNYAAVPCINAVMRIESARRDQVCGERRILAGAQQRIAGDAECIARLAD
jgi:hypothetical protein